MTPRTLRCSISMYQTVASPEAIAQKTKGLKEALVVLAKRLQDQARRRRSIKATAARPMPDSSTSEASGALEATAWIVPE